MIVYTLKCTTNHIFECWFPNTASYDEQKSKQLLSCPFCASSDVHKIPSPLSLSFQNKEPGESENIEIDSIAPFETAPSSFLPNFYTSKDDITDVIHLIKKKQKTSFLKETDVFLPSEDMLLNPAILVRKALLELKEFVKKNCDDVGAQFSEEVRRMHYGEARKRNIYGQASLDEILELHQEGVDVNAIPPFPREDA